MQSNASKGEEKSILSGLLFELSESDDLPLEFNEKLWNATIGHVTVYADERIVFSVKDSTDITLMLWKDKKQKTQLCRICFLHN